jgi:iron complex outermembrane receptor protein
MRQGDKFNWQIKSALLDETIDYQDTLILLFTHNQFRTWIGEAEMSFRPGNGMSLAGGVYSEVVKATSANYLSGTSRQQHAVFSSFTYIKRNWLWRMQFREEVTGDLWSPLLIDLSAEWSGIKHLVIKNSMSRNYRVPSLNDLYWRPGGNPDLQPEDGWTIESGVHYMGKDRGVALNSSMTAYARNINQWIMWMPPIKDIRNYWSPINIAEVRSHGIETRAEIQIKQKNWALGLRTGLDLTWSRFGTPVPEFMIGKGDQLFYVPVENVLTGLTIKSPHWSGYYHHHWYGPSTGINDDVNAADIGSAGITYQFLHPHLAGTLYLQVDNTWNVPYRIIERRPMPGRSILGGFKVSFY